MTIAEQMAADAAGADSKPASVAAQMSADAAPAAQKAAPTVSSNPFIAAGAGAGHIFGSSVLGVQQLAGKGIQAITPEGSTLNAAGQWLVNDATQGARRLDAEYAPYQQASPKAALGGTLAGAVVNPLNKLVPGGGGSGALGLVQAGAQGAGLSALLTPVTNEDNPFLYEKGKQAIAGALGGMAGYTAGKALGATFGKMMDWGRALFSRSGDAVGTADTMLQAALQHNGVTPQSMPQDLYSGIRQQVAAALKSGKSIDPDALDRIVKAQSLRVPVPLSAGQASRDPFQYAAEQNLSGIEGVGEPITDLMRRQNSALVENLDAMGAKGAPDIVDAGNTVIKSLQGLDQNMKNGVKAAYDAFKNSTGKDLDVPLTGLAQDYAGIKSNFEDVIPPAIRNKFEGLGLLSGSQAKTFSINDAEDLIKSINLNYNPQNLPQAKALNQLRAAVEGAISKAGSDVQGGNAAQLAQNARMAAASRFQLIDSNPLLKAAVQDKAPDNVIQQMILKGNQKDIQQTMGLLDRYDPDTANQVRSSVMGWIKSQVTRNASENQGNAIFSQDKMRQIVNDPNMAARLKAVFGDGLYGELQNLQETAENALAVPKQSAVNTSKTAATAANFVQNAANGGPLRKLLDVGASAHIPVVSPVLGAAAHGLATQQLQPLVQQAVNPSLARTWTPAEAESVRRLSDLLTQGAIRGGAATFAPLVQQRNQ